jgi:signal transduction histidine kinase
LGRLPENTELSIFRIVQEGLNNVWRHAQASIVEITLKFASSQILTITISDDGKGGMEDFDLAKLANNGHFGLIGINERIALLGGRFCIQQGIHGGSVLVAEIPQIRVMTEQEVLLEH